MSRSEYTVIVFGLVIGYWIVSKLIARKPRPQDEIGPDYSQSKDQANPEPLQSETSFIQPWENVLDVPRSSKTEDIRRAYKIKISQYHPDKVAALGSELQALAERKSKEINHAYRQAMRDRGVSEQLW
jgi:peptide deformylase